jgi:hypothetical protein
MFCQIFCEGKRESVVRSGSYLRIIQMRSKSKFPRANDRIYSSFELEASRSMISSFPTAESCCISELPPTCSAVTNVYRKSVVLVGSCKKGPRALLTSCSHVPCMMKTLGTFATSANVRKIISSEKIFSANGSSLTCPLACHLHKFFLDKGPIASG